MAQYLTPTDTPDPGEAGGTPASAVGSTSTGSTFGDYDLLEEIGRGGMGVVYRARHRGLDRLVALKMIIPSRLTSAKDLQRFRLEAETAAHLEHPNILPIYEVGEIGGQPYYTAKLLDSGSLTQQISERKTVKDRVRLFLKVCRAVAYAHARGVLHRDLKPGNILLDRDGEPYVADFGLARFLEKESDLTLSQAMVGTPAYAAPEQLREGARNLTTTADVYSLGTILYELLSGQPPLCGPTTAETVRRVLDEEAKPLRALNPEVDRDLEAICRKCLEKEPRRRYANAGELAQELEHYLAGEPIQARPLDTVALALRWCRRRPAVAGLIGAIAIAVLVVAVVSTIAALRIAASRRMQERENYYSLIGLAQSLVEQGEIDQAKEALLKCPARFRHWEWGHLMFRCHQDVLSIPAHTDAKFDAKFQGRSPTVQPQKVIFNHDGSQLASLGRDGSVKVWDAKDGHRLFVLGGTNRPAAAVVFNPRSLQLAVAFSDGAVEVWDGSAWRKQWEFRLATGKVEQLAYRPDGRRLALGGGREVSVCDATTGAVVGRWRTETPVTATMFLSDGTRLLVRTEGDAVLVDTAETADQATGPGAANKGLRAGNSDLWGGNTVAREAGTETVQERPAGAGRPPDSAGRPPGDAGHPPSDLWAGNTVARAVARELSGKPLALPPASGGSLFLSPTADRFVTISSEGIVSLWTNATAKMDLGEIRGAQPTAVRRVFFSDDGRRFCTGGELGTARVWDAETGKELLVILSKVHLAIFSPDGNRLVTVGTDTMARVWDLKDRVELLQLRGHSSSIDGAVFSPDGSRLATISQDGTLRLWRPHTGREVLRESLWAWGLAVSPDGRRIASSPAAEFTIWDAMSGHKVVYVDTRVHDVYATVFSLDSKQLVTVGAENTCRVWDVESGRLLFNLEGHTRTVRAVAYAPSGKQIATASRDGTARIWEARTGRQIRCLDHGSNLVCHVAFSPDSSRLATASALGLRMWDAESGRLVFEVRKEGSPLWRAIFSPDGKRLALIYTTESAVQICDAKTGSVLSTLPTGIAWNGAFSKDGRRFLVAVNGYDGVYGFAEANAQLWDCETGRRILLLKGHSEPFNEILFTADDQRIISSSFDMTVRQWETFPWREAEYPGTAGQPIQDRARRFADEYWQKRLAAEARRVEAVRSRPENEVLFPRRDARATSAQLDLTEHYNSVLQTWFLPWARYEDADNSLRELSCGLLELGSVQFDVRGVIALRRRTDGGDILARLWEHLPLGAKGIRVEQKVRSLRVLHGADRAAKEGAEIARFVWHYDTGREESRILYGEDVRDWWWKVEDMVPPTSAPSRVVWTGSNPVASEKGCQLRLYLTTIENPRPQELVKSLDYVSAMSDSAPFLIALTVE